jgi:hypothetical protein
MDPSPNIINDSWMSPDGNIARVETREEVDLTVQEAIAGAIFMMFEDPAYACHTITWTDEKTGKPVTMEVSRYAPGQGILHVRYVSHNPQKELPEPPF